MTQKNIFKTAVMLGLTLFLFACSKETNSNFEQKLLATPENETFVSIAKATDIATTFFGALPDNPATKSNARLASTETIRDSKNNNNPLMYVMNYAGGDL